MLLSEKREYVDLMMGLFEEYNAILKDSVINNWFSSLEDVPLYEFRQAIIDYIKNEKYPPRLAGIREYLPSQSSVGADEAWDHVPKSENESGYVTGRMMQALGVAEDLIANGDWIGARLAFIRTYNNLKPDDEFRYSEAYGVEYEEKEQRKINDYKLLENKGWMNKSQMQMIAPKGLLMIESGLSKTQTESNVKRVTELRLITSTMLNSSQKDTGKD